ncbi:CHC2 zinc finger domain-containing protein, partial [Sulfurimonas sp.]|uniref:CHC2 zinc finger domain-containing protein n=1 Tax=Sulfurimonas sp. TaxID=2022749 RepID=UPI00261B7B8E
MIDEPTLKQIKQSLDIVTVAELYGELKKNGANLSYKEDKSIVINPAKQIFSNFNGDITGGSVLDLVMYMEKIDLKTAIAKLKELSSLDTYKVDPSLQVQRKSKAKKKVDFNKLQEWGNEELKLVGGHRPIEYQTKQGKLIHFIVPSEIEKLFEAKTLPADYKQKLDYMFTTLVGWNKHFKCSSIIIKDDNGRIVDLIAYRPNKPDNYNEWSNPKYIYK